jgi:hypothetical protein
MKILIGFLLPFIAVGCWTDSYKPVFQTATLKLKSGEVIYLKKKNWGLTFDHQVSVISNSDKNEWKPDSTKEYVFKGLEPFFYKFSNDSLILFTRVNSQIPPNARFNVPIIQKQLTNSQYMDLFDKSDSMLVKF